MMVIFLCGLVALILLRTLRNDFARYAKEGDMDMEGGIAQMGEDSGWKQVICMIDRVICFILLNVAELKSGYLICSISSNI